MLWGAVICVLECKLIKLGTEHGSYTVVLLVLLLVSLMIAKFIILRKRWFVAAFFSALYINYYQVSCLYIIPHVNVTILQKYSRNVSTCASSWYLEVFSPTWPGYEASVNLRWSQKVYTSPNVSTSVHSPAPIPSSIFVVDTKACSIRSNQNFNSACRNDSDFSLIWLWVCYLTWKVMHIIGVTYFTFRRCVLLWLHLRFKHPSLLGRTPISGAHSSYE